MAHLTLQQARSLARVNLKPYLVNDTYRFIAEALVNVAPQDQYLNRPLVRRACNPQHRWTSTFIPCLVKFQVIKWLITQGLKLESVKTISVDELRPTNHTPPRLVIHDGILKEYIGIGWVEKRQASFQDLNHFPLVTG